MTFEDVLKTYGPALKRVAASYLPPGSDREDLEQEIALNVYQSLRQYRGEASLRTYLYRIAHNCGIRALHSETVYKEEPLKNEPSSSDFSPEDDLLQRERYEWAAHHIRTLPLKWRQPLIMRLDGLSYDEIAQVLGLSTNTVGVRIHRATVSLKESMRNQL